MSAEARGSRRRPAPPAIERLPPQFFAGILGAAARAQASDAAGHTPPAGRFIDLGRGNPDLPPPAHALAAMTAAAEQTATPAVHGYPPFGGHAELREAVAQRYRADHGVELDPEREVAVVPGTKTGIMLVCLAAAGAGDTVLLPDPGYPDYRSGAALSGARVVDLPLEPSAGFQPDLDAVADVAAPALMVLNYPSNPCGACERPGTFEAATAYAHERGSWLLHDLAYGFLAFDGHRARSVLEVEGARDVAVELWSPSKIYGMAGWRIGLLVGAAELVGRVQTLLDHATAGVWTGFQRGLSAALASDQADVAQRRAVYARRRERLVGTLAAAGADLAPAEGSFFVWWRLPEGLTAERLASELRVGVAPGEGFGPRGAGWARLSLALDDAELDDAAHRIAAALRQPAG